MPPKTSTMTQAQQEQFRASLVVNLAKHWDGPLSALGVPPATASKKTCSGHGGASTCPVCRFGFCQSCGGGSAGTAPVFWNGRCNNCRGAVVAVDAETAESNGRVRELAQKQIGERIVASPESGRVKRKAERVCVSGVEPVAKAPPAMKAEAATKVAPVKHTKASAAPPPPKKRNAPAPLSQLCASVDLSGAGAAGVRIVSQDTRLVNHADGSATLTFTAKIARN